MVNGANAAPESICSGAPGLKRSVKLSGETDCATEPFRSAPASPTMRLSTSNNREYVRFVEQIVCYRGREEDASVLRARRGPPWREARRVWLAVQIKAHKRKQKKINASKIAFFYYRLFFGIGSFQWVTADSNKNFLPSPKLPCEGVSRKFPALLFPFRGRPAITPIDRRPTLSIARFRIPVKKLCPFGRRFPRRTNPLGGRRPPELESQPHSAPAA